MIAVVLALGAVCVVVGVAGVLRWAGDRPAAVGAGWYPDPSATRARRRRWDGATWSPEVTDGDQRADRGRRLRGRFWGVRWVSSAVAAVAVGAAGGAWWLGTRSDVVLVGLSVVVTALVCVAVHQFLDRQLALHEVISGRTVLAAALAGIGAPLLVALPLNDAIAARGGLTLDLAVVGPVEEATKLLVPVGLFLLGRLRAPRAGVALGLASGFGFAVMEAGLYAITVPAGSSPDPCTGSLLPAPGVDASLRDLLERILFTEPVHWLATGFAVAVIWRQWHRRGPRVTAPVVGVVVLVMAAHSLYDSSAVWFCGSGQGGTLAHALIGYGVPITLYVLLRAAARRSLPPALVGRVSRGWHPRRLRSTDVFPDPGSSDRDVAEPRVPA